MKIKNKTNLKFKKKKKKEKKKVSCKYVLCRRSNRKLCEFMARHQRFRNRVVCNAVVIFTITRRIRG